MLKSLIGPPPAALPRPVVVALPHELPKKLFIKLLFVILDYLVDLNAVVWIIKVKILFFDLNSLHTFLQKLALARSLF